MIRKLLTVFAVMMVCFGMTPMNINAEEEVYATKYEINEEVVTRAPLIICPNCTAQAQKLREYGAWDNGKKVSCSHGKSGTDTLYTRSVYNVIKCANCGYYSKTFLKTDTKIICEGS